MHKMLRQSQAVFRLAENRALRHPNIGERNTRMVGRHIEGPHIFFNLHPRIIGRHQKARNAFGRAVIARSAGKQHDMARHMHAGGPHFLAIQQPAIDPVTGFAHAARFHPSRIRAMVGFGQAETNAMGAGQHAIDKFIGLLGRAEIAKHQHLRKIADNRTFILQIIMQPQAFMRQMLANARHRQIGAVGTAIFFRQTETQMPRLVGTAAHFAQ